VLFLLYLNDLEAGIEHRMPTSFVNNTNIFIADNNANDIQRNMNTTVNKLTELFKSNGLLNNKEKTIAIPFHHPEKVQLECPSVKLYGTAINYTDHP
jgi:hypothetical protein